MSIENFTPPEVVMTERILEGVEREKFVRELTEYVSGLEAAIADPDLPEEERAELEEQLAGLKDSQEAIEAGGPIKMGK